MSTRHRTLLGIFTIIAIAAGCSSAAPAPTHEPNTTVIRTNPDGSPRVFSYYASPEQIRREAYLKEAYQAQKEGRPLPPAPQDAPNAQADGIGQTSAAIYNDSNCAGADVWIYSGNSCTGNRICFHDAGTANLWSYGFYIGGFWVYWANNVYSYWPGDESGYFTDGWNQTWNSFSAYQSCTTVNRCGAYPCYALTLN